MWIPVCGISVGCAELARITQPAQRGELTKEVGIECVEHRKCHLRRRVQRPDRRGSSTGLRPGARLRQLTQLGDPERVLALHSLPSTLAPEIGEMQQRLPLVCS